KGIWRLLGKRRRELLLRKFGMDIATLVNAFMIKNAINFDIDAVSVMLSAVTSKIELLSLDSYKDEYGRINKISEGNLLWYEGGTLNSHEVLDEWGFPNPLDPLRIKIFDTAAKITEKKGMFLIPCLGGMMETLYEAVGIEKFFYLLYDDPSFIRRIMDLQKKFLTELAKFLIEERNIEVVIFGDDSAYKSGPMMSVKHFEQYIFPRYKSIINAIHKRGAKALLHSDGDTRLLIPGWVKAGIDGLHPWEPTAGWTLAEAKDTWGDKIAILGNIDCNTLTYGPPERIQREVIQAIRDAGPGGGYIMSSGNSIHYGISPEHFRVMIETCRKYGTYPLSFPD
ncbi:MAG: uroporphyrinogen decarboxylase family protein, partial [Candidatus Helarchaeota archaeon]